MNRNVEIKARVESLDGIERRACELASEGPLELEQEDTFFTCPRGRLKLRRLAGTTEGELIYYERPNMPNPKESHYAIHRTLEPERLCAVLSAGVGIRGVVRKRRTLYIIGSTRVHLDRVEGLGEFVELEVILTADQKASDGVVLAKELMGRLGISQAGLVHGAYIDLLEAGCP